jgi:hypothetical protein
VLAPAAAAHGPAGASTGYVSTFSALEPNVVGVLVAVLGGDDRLRLSNYSGKAVVVSGYAGEPFLRFGPAGVFENVRSPATYLSRERDPARAHVPATADPRAAPRWRRVARGKTFEWHDHRIHWTRPSPPAAVAAEPDAVHLIRRWHVPARAGTTRFAISGFLGYSPPQPQRDGGTSRGTWAAALGAVVLVVAAIGEGVRRTRRRTP